MEKVQTSHSGRFTLRSYAQLMKDGRHQAVFTVTEHMGDADEDTKQQTGLMFGAEADAVEAGMEAAIAWLEEFRPVNG